MPCVQHQAKATRTAVITTLGAHAEGVSGYDTILEARGDSGGAGNLKAGGPAVTLRMEASIEWLGLTSAHGSC